MGYYLCTFKFLKKKSLATETTNELINYPQPFTGDLPCVSVSRLFLHFYRLYLMALQLTVHALRHLPYVFVDVLIHELNHLYHVSLKDVSFHVGVGHCF